MLSLYPAYVAWHYFLWICLAALGVIQAAAAAAGLRGLQIGGRLWPPRLARAMLGVTVAGGAALFVLTSPDYVSPGLAGSELIAMFGAGTLVALVLSVVGGLACRAPGSWRPVAGEEQLAGGCTYRLREPVGEAAGLALLLPDPDLPEEASEPVERAVLAAGWACLRLGWVGRHPIYPDCLAIVPSALTMLADRGREAVRPLVIGLGLAGDLALRAASDDGRLVGACVVGPALAPSGVLDGLLLLREMSLPAAWHWRQQWDRRAWVRSLRSQAALVQLGERASVLADRNDGYFEAQLLAGSPAEVVGGSGHRGLVREWAPQFVARQLSLVAEVELAGA